MLGRTVFVDNSWVDKEKKDLCVFLIIIMNSYSLIIVYHSESIVF